MLRLDHNSHFLYTKDKSRGAFSFPVHWAGSTFNSPGGVLEDEKKGPNSRCFGIFMPHPRAEKRGNGPDRIETTLNELKHVLVLQLSFFAGQIIYDIGGLCRIAPPNFANQLTIAQSDQRSGPSTHPGGG